MCEVKYLTLNCERIYKPIKSTCESNTQTLLMDIRFGIFRGYHQRIIDFRSLFLSIVFELVGCSDLFFHKIPSKNLHKLDLLPANLLFYLQSKARIRILCIDQTLFFEGKEYRLANLALPQKYFRNFSASKTTAS